ncbi:hypothetical protein B7494_g8317 [Chlorociboria aeruginascens]|nr:hypothetical protein B7494_g8317 [Chlorociboria aeruginascens]
MENIEGKAEGMQDWIDAGLEVVNSSGPSSSSHNLVCVTDIDILSFRPDSVEKYPAKLHARAVARKLGVNAGLIYLPGGTARTFEDSDQLQDFRQLRYFFYLSGVDFPGCIVTYNIRKDDLSAWIPPPNTGRDVIYNGPSPTVEDVRARYEFDHVGLKTKELNDYLTHFNERECGLTYVLDANQAPQQFRRAAMNDTGSQCISTIPPYNSISLKAAMDACRVIKSPYEIKQIRKASAITAEAHTQVLRSIKKLSNEAEIEAVFTSTCISKLAKKQAYNVIAGSGVNASTLHYGSNNEPLEGRQLVCLDAGCEWGNYASDVTRTFPISGQWSKEAKQIHAIVELMQAHCIRMVKPGADYRAIHMKAHEIAVHGLMTLGILRGGYEELYKSGVTVAFFPHGLGHYMGLECHDVGDGGALLYHSPSIYVDWFTVYHRIQRGPSPNAASILAPNMVITVEPGLYFSRYAIDFYTKDERYSQYINTDLLEKYYPVGGVRIEDDILVTEDGYENLTTAPKGKEMLRIINGEDKEENYGETKKDDEEKKKKKKKGWFW